MTRATGAEICRYFHERHQDTGAGHPQIAQIFICVNLRINLLWSLVKDYKACVRDRRPVECAHFCGVAFRLRQFK
jgi:hypothetical protein